MCASIAGKKKHGIIFKSLSGERESVNEESTDKWVEDVLKPTLQRYDPRNVFNLDEAALFWKLLPVKGSLFFKPGVGI